MLCLSFVVMRCQPLRRALYVLIRIIVKLFIYTVVKCMLHMNQ
ncbi:TPA: acetyltransferase [Vibrio vulnificus]|uniref:Acetyltransferase n=1 Tax=Vibrio vulnificus TaxID=672 RepID=A0A8H9N5A3_VIBVL|nr:acetyltransferase [Vibrio vulnificus]